MEVTDSEVSFGDRKLLSGGAQKGLRSPRGARQHAREAQLRFTNFAAFQDAVKSE